MRSIRGWSGEIFRRNSSRRLASVTGIKPLGLAGSILVGPILGSGHSAVKV